jgi:hypothetical protein
MEAYQLIRRAMSRKEDRFNEIYAMEVKEGMSRKVTSQVLEMVEEGILDKDTVIMACLKYMSEDEVADMAHINGFTDTDEEGE